ncbi:hypothetical protein SAMN05444169_6542 [Bradyrhizobium erythrophlei]|uniref:DUF3102 domain-containing protein n=2 Tax=Bradyrhizobium erythrophlei TaxID=1437360 RepID=A0A1M5RGG5_9BRAD|nr:hypothetical protein SAMN05444169_6542 [Bradyrhizobium erythrophlei]
MTGISIIRSTFDYNCLAPADAASLREHANKLRGLIAKSTADMIQVGRDLLAIKDRLEHGQFTVWVEHEIGIGIRTVQMYMQMSRLAEGKNETISLLPPSTVRMLAAKSTSPEIVEKVIARAGSGDILPESAVKEMISDDRQTKRNAKLEAKAAARRSKARGARAGAAAKREAWLAQQELEKAEDQAKAQSIINRFSPEDVRFLANTLTWRVYDEFCRLVESGVA